MTDVYGLWYMSTMDVKLAERKLWSDEPARCRSYGRDFPDSGLLGVRIRAGPGLKWDGRGEALDGKDVVDLLASVRRDNGGGRLGPFS